jgi:hypothetical protein
MGDMMLRSMPLRFAAVVLIAAAAVSLSAASAWAFSQENLQSGGTGNAAIADPDDQFTNSGQGAHPFGPNGPTLQFGVQQRTVAPFGSFQGDDRDGSPPDPYFHPPGNGNN